VKVSITRSLANSVVNLYERQLLEAVMEGSIPKHIAVIMDGNRRFARKLGIGISRGHSKGKDKLEEILDWCLELDIEYITVYALSTENFTREAGELDGLMALYYDGFSNAAIDDRVHDHGIRIRAIGRRDLLPDHVLKAIELAEESTKHYDKHFFNIAVAYGGREELLNAIRLVAQEVAEGKLEPDSIEEADIRRYLYTLDMPDPDLVLRTSGEERISNFLIWQAAYSELYFTDIFWPEFRKLDFLRAIETYQKRQRRFGT